MQVTVAVGIHGSGDPLCDCIRGGSQGKFCAEDSACCLGCQIGLGENFESAGESIEPLQNAFVPRTSSLPMDAIAYRMIAANCMRTRSGDYKWESKRGKES